MTITVYDHMPTGFRVAVGLPLDHAASDAATVRTYESAAVAYALEDAPAIRAAILLCAPDLDQFLTLVAHTHRALCVRAPIASGDAALRPSRTAAESWHGEPLIECASCGHAFTTDQFYGAPHASVCADLIQL